MSVVPIGHASLTQADINVLTTEGNGYVSDGICGACCVVELEDSEPLIALTDPEDEYLCCAIGKMSGWYYVLDADWNVTEKSKFLGDILEALPAALAEAHPPAAQCLA